MKKILLIFILAFLLSGCVHETLPPIQHEYDNPPIEAEPQEPVNPSEQNIPESADIFQGQEKQAVKLLENMTTEEKVGQMFLVRCPEDNKKDLYLSMNPGGFIMFGKDFSNKTKDEVIKNIEYFQSKNKTPMIIAVDEEGGTVTRVSANPLLYPENFKSPQELYDNGGFEEIKNDAVLKSALLSELGINLNLAPVADVSINKDDFIYDRSFGKPAQETALYVKTVIEAMNGSSVSSCLKHFPGYGSNTDTHTGSAVDERHYEQLENSDFIPFAEGIKSGAQCVLVSHNIVKAIDPELPASLSKKAVDILKINMDFTGIIMTDDLSMGAVTNLETTIPPEILAVDAGEDMLIVTDFEHSYTSLLNAVNSGKISEERINESVLKILKWKLSKGMFDAR